MTNQLFQEVEVDTNVLKMKKNLNTVKRQCGELESQDKAVRCFNKVKEAENEIEDIVRGDAPKDRIQRIHNERENSQSINDLVDKEMY